MKSVINVAPFGPLSTTATADQPCRRAHEGSTSRVQVRPQLAASPPWCPL